MLVAIDEPGANVLPGGVALLLADRILRDELDGRSLPVLNRDVQNDPREPESIRQSAVPRDYVVLLERGRVPLDRV